MRIPAIALLFNQVQFFVVMHDLAFGMVIKKHSTRFKFSEHIIQPHFLFILDANLSMANSVGDLTPDGDFVQSIMQFTETLVDDNFTDYRDMLMEVKGGSLLEELDELNTEVWLKNLLKSSVAFMALTRCGYDARLYLDADDFQHLREFNTQEVVSVLGGASSDIAEMALREIEATVRALGKAEKTHAHTFAQSPSLGIASYISGKNEDDICTFASAGISGYNGEGGNTDAP